MLSVRNLSVKLGRGRPVDGVSFDIAAGETFALLGESGCGKSMTALALMGLLPNVASIERGSIEFEGRELTRLDETAMRRLRGGAMGMIFQEPGTSLNPVLTIGYQIGESLAVHRDLRGAAAKKRAIELLDAVGIPDAARRHDEYPFQLSGGMKQRAMIAMVLAGEPRLLIADEPTTALDVTIQAQVLDLLASLQRRSGNSGGMGLLLITHDLGVVSRVADRIGVMYAGQLVEVASREKFFSSPAHPYSRALFAAVPDANARGGPLATIPGRVPPLESVFSGCRFADRCDYVKELCRGREPPLAPLGEGRYVRCYFPVRGELREHATQDVSAVRAELVDAQEALLDVTGLKVHFPIRKGVLQRVAGHVRAVDGVSLRLAPGKTLALVGESGCGKTTAGKAILQLIKADEGSVKLSGTELTQLTARQLRPLRAAMQMVFQDPFASLNPRMRVGAIVAEGMRALQKQDNHEQRVGELLQQVGLAPEMADRYPHEFSGGQRQRIAIARALAVNPQLLICDEPTSALDVSVQAQILNLLKELQATLGLAYLFITHNIAVVDYLAQEVAVMYLGRIVERGTTDEVLRAPKHPYTQALIVAVPRITMEREGDKQVPVAPGDIPSPAKPPSGCHFHPRCPQAMEVCRSAYPAATTLSPTRVVHCHLYG
ncbi:Glutathione import ATP-binding protein GsiA [Georgfuchsia toluolica]|uniref:Glutathione import ATP-binding protein GsiA n=1 Tax=Georgfuchsia toluolica TaxID=424218 RepID=A0A916J8W7_9PROT|nr:ABC transporter ATP-binding protein [Georgfuchsia toluolica]CAG4885332.1 Glutathione import ATP-binding protein GsiA [Georgfuchsia toluolica]